MHNHLYNSLSQGQTGNGDQLFALCPNNQKITYHQFFHDVECATQLLIEHGLTSNNRVVLIAEKSLASITAYIATVAAGGIFVPLNAAYTDAELAYFINDVQPSIIICDPQRTASLEKITNGAGVKKIFTLDHNEGGTFRSLWKKIKPVTIVSRTDSDLAAILYTSGTTGKPKGAMLSHGALASNSEILANIWCFSKEDRLIHALPIDHTHGLFVAVNVSLIAGAAMIFLKRFDADKVLRLMPQATSMMGIPTFYTRLLQLSALNARQTRHMRLFISGSAPLSTTTHHEWKSRTGHEILERYGMTEANMICSIPHDGPRIPGTVGRPLPGVKVRIRDTATGETVTNGRTGMLEIYSPSLFSGYWNLPEKTAEQFTDDKYFLTGDIARINVNDYIEIVGRAKDIVISGGVNLYPKEIETAIEISEGVIESAVIGVPHPDFGECAVAIVVADHQEQLVKEAILSTLNKKLARFKHPKHIAFVPALPRNAMGKIQKTVLRQEFANLFME